MSFNTGDHAILAVRVVDIPEGAEVVIVDTLSHDCSDCGNCTCDGYIDDHCDCDDSDYCDCDDSDYCDCEREYCNCNPDDCGCDCSEPFTEFYVRAVNDNGSPSRYVDIENLRPIGPALPAEPPAEIDSLALLSSLPNGRP